MNSFFRWRGCEHSASASLDDSRDSSNTFTMYLSADGSDEVGFNLSGIALCKYKFTIGAAGRFGPYSNNVDAVCRVCHLQNAFAGFFFKLQITNH